MTARWWHWRRFNPTTRFAPSTLAEMAWQRTRGAVARWGLWGALCGALVALVVFAPASWAARAVAAASGQRLLLAEPRGSVWSGSALAVLTGGAGSRDASVLPDRLRWTLRLRGLALELRLRQACCIQDELVMQLRPGWGRFQARVQPNEEGELGRWPAAWLAGLGTPWNTLQLGGVLRLTTSGLTVESVQGRLRIDGQAQLQLLDVSSRLSTLPTLGSYELSIAGSGGHTALSLQTVEGALQLTGTGQVGAGGMRFRGEARAEEGSEAALNNLLNIIGRRQGASALISIG